MKKKKLNQKGFHELYKPWKKLGKGNFATVFSARKCENNNVYAVKALSKEKTLSNVTMKASVKKEIEVMRRVNESHIMKLFEVFESDNTLYLIFEFLEGGCL